MKAWNRQGMLGMALCSAMACAAGPVPDKPVPATPAVAPVVSAPVEAPVAMLALALPRVVRLGGFELAVSHDASKLRLGEPVSAKALTGYLCQANTATPGVLRMSCVGLVGEDRGGELAVIPVYGPDAPVLADFTILSNDVVDDAGKAIPELAVGMAVIAPPAVPPKP